MFPMESQYFCNISDALEMFLMQRQCLTNIVISLKVFSINSILALSTILYSDTESLKKVETHFNYILFKKNPDDFTEKSCQQCY